MIATILPSSTTFHAVAYNEKKVANGVASLLAIKGFGNIEKLGYSTPEELQEYLMEYSKRNTRIEKTQMHVAFSCKGHEYTPEQLVDIANQWLDKMGYGDPEQPVLIYEHHDTDNTHIHVVTSRVNPKGKKIDHNHEKRKSQKVLEKIMNTNMKEEVDETIQAALSFDFRTESQFKAILEAMNLECYEKEGQLKVKKGGTVQSTIDLRLINDAIIRNNRQPGYDLRDIYKIRAILKKYRDINCSKMGLERDLKRLFGYSLVFLGKSDSPYGYAFIDFNNKKVYQGSHILSVKELLSFKSAEQLQSEIENFIHHAMETEPDLGTRQLNRGLRRFGAYIKKGCVYFGDNNTHPLSDVHIAMLKRNDKTAWRNEFFPQSEAERDVVCKLTGWEYPQLIKIHMNPGGKYYTKNYDELSAILSINETKEKISAFETAGFRYIIYNGSEYIFRADTQTIIDVERSGFERTQYEDLATHYREIQNSRIPNQNTNQKSKQPKEAMHSVKWHGNSEGSGYANREWEVGKRGYDPDDMDRNNGLSY